jgi:hypothetical protein
MTVNVRKAAKMLVLLSLNIVAFFKYRVPAWDGPQITTLKKSGCLKRSKCLRDIRHSTPKFLVAAAGVSLAEK